MKSQTHSDDNRARARTDRQLALQEKCFELSVFQGRTYREIAKELNINKDTVIAYMRHEHERRKEEHAARREFEADRAISFYERMIARSMKRADIADGVMSEVDKERPWISDRSLDTAMKARERIDSLLGLETSDKIEKTEIIIRGGLPPRPQ